MHPNTLNEMQRNLIEIRYRPEMKVHMFICMLHCKLQQPFSLNNEFTARTPDWESSSTLSLVKSLEATNDRNVHTIPSGKKKWWRWWSLQEKLWWFPSRKGKTLKCFNNNIKTIAYTYWIAAVSEESEASFTLWTESETKVTIGKEIYYELANGRTSQHDRPWHWTTYAFFFKENAHT